MKDTQNIIQFLQEFVKITFTQIIAFIRRAVFSVVSVMAARTNDLHTEH
jgi:hypothetical protein